ncbi:hypothetical protein [Ammoniphilus sp. CFH 90114]|uniref:hypothetical protein n=1 Tax=Ammoniphilus sp. CFH 90114 TaxID=2493665 RepID=UPI00100FB428|nr:hypothetical protein [Ammoniphilus sp. CFH 90114]RXT08048.1 hypothetical protein EIZ39_11600 [Ammoniphilus sp. CFH 90114]
MIGLLAMLALGAGVAHVIKKYLLRIKDPTLSEVWTLLDKQDWYQQLIQEDRFRKYIETQKQEGLLSDWYYVKKIIEQKGARDGFIEYVEKNAK